MEIFVDRSKLKIKKLNFKPIILFAEGWNQKIQTASIILQSESYLEPMIILKTRSELNNNIIDIKHFIIEENDLENYALKLFEIRKSKGITIEQARDLVKEPNYLATMMLKMEEVDGVVCGIEYTTKETLRPALQIIKAKESSKIITSAIIFEREEEVLIFGDCSLVLDPTSEELAEITKEIMIFAHDTLSCQNMNTAMLSYSTTGSGSGKSVDKVRDAYEIVKRMPEITNYSVYGEIQFDAAYVNSVREQKAPDCQWEKKPNIYIFPNLDAGNIGYKILERCGNYFSIGPIIVGLDKPMNDLSRGASAASIVSIAYITAAQIKIKKEI